LDRPVLKAGTAYVPLGLNLPAKRVEYILADSQATCVLIG
jgi:non-ribosomal peptide synthetase component F